MKRFLLRLAAAAVLAAALGPVALRQYGLWQADRRASEYLDAVAALEPEALEALLADADAYNRSLADEGVPDPFAPEAGAEGEGAERSPTDPAGNGVLAVLEIPKLGERLPVYSGAGDRTPEAGAVHLEGTSLPVEGAGTPCVLAARRGGWVAGPFAALDRLLPGDGFVVRGPEGALTYEVTRVYTLEPEALASWRGDGAEECLLLTTAPRGSDARRLLVQGRRVAPGELTPLDDTRELAPWAAGLALAAPMAAAGLILLTAFEGFRRAIRRRRLNVVWKVERNEKPE